MPNHGLCGRPVDLFESPNPRVWKLTAEGPTRRDVVGLFNWNTKGPADISVDLLTLRLPRSASGKYVGFDYWADEFVAPFGDKLTAKLAPGSCRVIALRAVEDRPVLVSTSRHITQGVVDVQAEAWDAKSNILSGTSLLVPGDPYELRIFAPGHTAVSAEAAAGSGALATKVSQSGPNVRVKITSTAGGQTKWKVIFKRGLR
jgi:hypothetical protein